MNKCEKCGYKGKEKSCPKCHGKMVPMGLSEMMKGAMPPMKAGKK